MKTLSERFFSKVGPRVKGGCRLWTAHTNPLGYGQIGKGGRVLLAHRVAWELAHEPVPEGLCVLHRCDVPGCVSIRHLFLGTRADNAKDMVSKGRSQKRNASKTHCLRGHPLSGENLYLYEGTRQKKLHRACKACKRIRDAQYKK